MSELKTLNMRKNSKHKKGFSLIHIILLVILVGLIGLFVYSFLRPSKPAVFQVVSSVVGAPKDTLIKDDQGRINVLLLGIGGGNHDGANLTDTIMVASYNTETKDVTLISLPRDLWSDQYKEKINAIYETGLEKNNGLGLAEQEIGNIMGLNISYAVRVDFSGFVKAVDLIGGIDVNVAHSFDDYFYPVEGKEDDLCGYQIKDQEVPPDQAQKMGVTPGNLQVLLDPQGNIATASASPSAQLNLTEDQAFEYFGCRFEHLSFKQGLTHMDGTTALKFVRSRHGNNGENSDFARSKRQQLVIQAFKQKVLSLNILTDVNKLISLANTFQSSVDTNIAQSNYLEFAKIAKDINKINSYSVDTSGTHPLLTVPNSLSAYGGAWVLVPSDKDFSGIQSYVSKALSGQLESTGSATISP